MRDNADQSRFVKDQEADDAWKEGFREPYHAAAAAHCTLSVAVHAVGPSIGCPARWRMDSSPPRAAASAFSSVSDRLRPTRSPRWAWRSTRYIRARGQRVPASKDGRQRVGLAFLGFELHSTIPDIHIMKKTTGDFSQDTCGGC
ncbi:hypothetical protein B296_00042922 [Ensete ventricosum]|uniref:Uncharacterized protein n=1 Tax=Ensete ventricosum TaxID=4639 RepID=A0A426ZGN0_ENSVE|nr:hypothetical protein B296_00042922 [Ensete ventricosum]